MKKVLPLLMAILLTIQGNVFSDALDDAWLAGDESYQETQIIDDIGLEEIRLLHKLGVLNSFAEGTFNSGEFITRSEFVGIITGILAGEVTYDASEQAFNDVTPNHEYYHAIQAAYQLGLVSASESGAFGPDEDITYNQAAKILVQATGYGVRAENSGGYPAGYVAQAASIGILRGITLNGDEALPKGAAAILIFNALNIDIMDRLSYGTAGKWEVQNGHTLLYKYRKIVKGSGIVTATPYTSLYSVVGAGENAVAIDRTVYRYDGGGENENFSDFLGHNVDYYYYDESPPILVAVTARNSRTHITRLNAENIIGLSGNTLTHGSEGGRVGSVKLPFDASVIYNGRLAHVHNNGIFEPGIGSIEIIDNDGDGDVDVVIANKYVTFAVFSVNVVEEVIVSRKGGEQLDISAATAFLLITDDGGNSLNLSEIAEWDVLSVLASEDGQYMRIHVHREVIQGKVTEINHSKKYAQIFIDGVAYGAATELDGLSTGDSGSFYLDINNKIADFSLNIGETEIGYMVRAATAQETKWDMEIKLVTANGEVNVYSVADKFYLDAQLVRNSGQIPVELSQPSMIRYRLNGDLEIDMIDTVNKGSNEGEGTIESLAAKGKRIFYRLSDAARTGTLSGKIMTNADTKVFVYPEIESGNDTDFYVTDHNYFAVNSEYMVAGFITSQENMVAQAVTVETKHKGDIVRGSENALVRKITLGTDEEGNSVKNVYVYSGATEKKLIFKDDKLLTDSNVSVGDIIKFTVNNSVVTNLIVIFRAASCALTNESIIPTSTYGDIFRVVDRYVYNRSGNYVALTTTARQPLNVDDIEFLTLPTSIYVVDLNERNAEQIVRSGTAADIEDYTHHSTSSKSLTLFRYAIPQMFVVYK